MKLVFVYNANAGFVAGIMDTIHKTVSPDTYDCALCAVTHGAFTMDKEWRAYLKALPIESAFYHRPDFRLAFPDKADCPLPIIAVERDGRLEIILGADELKQAHEIPRLMSALDDKLLSLGVFSRKAT